MSVFTDVNIERLKAEIANEQYGELETFEWKDMLSLLARLEAAESVIESHPGLWEEGDLYEAWRKACGK